MHYQVSTFRYLTSIVQKDSIGVAFSMDVPSYSDVSFDLCHLWTQSGFRLKGLALVKETGP